MARGRKAESLPEFIEVSEDLTRVKCGLCTEYNPRDYNGAWIQKSSLPPHLKSSLHKSSVGLQQSKQARDAAIERTIQEEVMFGELEFVTLRSDARLPIKAKALQGRPNAAEKMMWEDHEMHDSTFDAGEDPAKCHNLERLRLEHQMAEFGLWDGVNDMLIGVNQEATEVLDDLVQDDDDLAQDDLLSEILRNEDLDLGISSPDSFEEQLADKKDSEWFPYKSKLMFLLDAVDNLPRLRISSSLMKVLLWLLRESGVKNVPSFYSLRNAQLNVRKKSGVPTVSWMSPKGNPFSFNDPRTLVAMDWANPLASSHLRRYPVIPPNGVISEVYHAQKWRSGIDRHILSPMYDNGRCHFYIDEPARLKDGNFVIPLRWLEDSTDQILVDAWRIDFDSNTSLANIVDNETITINAFDLQDNMLDLQASNLIPTWSRATIDAGHLSRMPNPDRALADGDPIYTSFIDIFGDDVSGNRSKSWNKHWNTYMNHRNLPRKLLQQEFHTHFVSTSTHASIPEQFQGIKEVIESTHRKPVKVRYGKTGQQIRFRIYCNCGPGDNPAQSEVSGHIGGNGNHPCRKCEVGGTQKEKESNEGFHSMFMPGNPRSSQGILAEVELQIKSACLGVAQTVKDRQTDTGIKDAYSQYWIDILIERARGLHKDQPTRTTASIQAELYAWVEVNKPAIYNSFLTMKGFDVAQDTPVEILHTVLLGIVKYLWHGSHTPWTAAQKKTYSIWLQCTNTSGLSIHAIRANYIMQYANSLIGRQFKTIAQVNVFHVYDLVDELRFLLTKAVGELAALLWITEIRDLDEYLCDVEVAAGNVLDLFALIDPSKLISKIKLHLLAHLRADIIRFGPLVGVATEVFECFNAIFRYCSILSNHLAPSRDIAIQLASQESVKHCLTGGWWPTENGEWEQPSPAVCQFITANPMLQALFGWSQAKLFTQGTIKLEPCKRGLDKKLQPRATLMWLETRAACALNNIPQHPLAQWNSCRYAIAASQDKCTVGSWVFARSPLALTDGPVTGRIVEILASTTEESAIAVLDIFQIASTRHELFGMPVLSRRHEEIVYLNIPTHNLQFEYNVQHDCQHLRCTASGERPLMQERVQSGHTELFIVHDPTERYIINMHAFHNAHLLRATLPRNLTAPIPLSFDRSTEHYKIAATLRAVQDGKRTAAAAKTAAKKATLATTASKKRKTVPATST